MDIGQTVQQKRNPNVERVLMPYFIAFFITGNDFIHDSIKPLPMYVKLYLLVSHVFAFIEKMATVIVINLAFVKSSMDLGLVSLLTTILIAVLNSLVGQLVLFMKWSEVRKMLKELNDITTDIMDDDSVFHKKALRIQRLSMLFILGSCIIGALVTYEKGLVPEIDSWIFNNASSFNFGYNSRPAFMTFVYISIQLWCLSSHLIFVCFFVVLSFYIQANFESLREKCLSGIRQLKESPELSIPRAKRTADKVIVWDTVSPAKDRQPLRGSQHPVWSLLRRHQALSQLVTRMNATFRETIAIWSFSELTIIIFVIRALNIGVSVIGNSSVMIVCAVVFIIVFVSKSLCAGGINKQVGSLFRLEPLLRGHTLMTRRAILLLKTTNNPSE